MSFYDVFSKTAQMTAKTIFNKNERFQAETNVIHKCALLDNFWPNDNVDVITFSRFFSPKLLKSLPKTILHETHVLRLKRTFFAVR